MIIIIPTCERPALFARLMSQLSRDLSSQDHIIVHDDGSAEPYVDDVFAALKPGFPFTTVHSYPRRGRKGYWKTVDLLVKQTERVGSDADEPVFFLADDLVLAPGWVERSISLLDKHSPSAEQSEARTRCLGVVVYTDHRSSEWGYQHEPYDENGERVPWMDGAFVTRRFWTLFLSPGPVDRNWNRFPTLGSGVWAKVSMRTNMLGLWWYRPYISLSHHDDQGKSMMCRRRPRPPPTMAQSDSPPLVNLWMSIGI